MNPSRIPVSLLALALVAALIALAGCGDDDESTATTGSVPESAAPSTEDSGLGESPAAGEGSEADDYAKGSDVEVESTVAAPRVQIEDGATAFLVSPDSKIVCQELITDGFLKKSYGNVAACLQGRPQPTLAKSADVTAPDIGSDEATVTATPQGGLYDGVEVKFTFVADGELWRIDSVSADVPVGP